MLLYPESGSKKNFRVNGFTKTVTLHLRSIGPNVQRHMAYFSLTFSVCRVFIVKVTGPSPVLMVNKLLSLPPSGPCLRLTLATALYAICFLANRRYRPPPRHNKILFTPSLAHTHNLTTVTSSTDDFVPPGPSTRRTPYLHILGLG